MAKILIDVADYNAIKKRITDLENLLKQPSASLFSRVVQGVQVSPAIVLPANVDSYTFIDGLDITADVDSTQVLVDLNVMASATAISTSIKLNIEVDGQLDERAAITWAASTSSRYIYTAIIICNAGAGLHRYRAMVSSATAITLTLTDQSRYMRVTGIINNRRRFSNERST